MSNVFNQIQLVTVKRYMLIFSLYMICISYMYMIRYMIYFPSYLVDFHNLIALLENDSSLFCSPIWSFRCCYSKVRKSWCIYCTYSLGKNVGLEIISNDKFSSLFFFLALQNVIYMYSLVSPLFPICATTFITFQPSCTGSLALWKCCHLIHLQENCLKEGFLSCTVLSDFNIYYFASAQDWPPEACSQTHNIRATTGSSLVLSADPSPPGRLPRARTSPFSHVPAARICTWVFSTAGH